jgi:NADH:ubiquinone reductase (H+-translocating)
MSEHHRTRVVVLGGGYAGTTAANHLRLRDDLDITLVNPRAEFVERIRLHQLAAGTGTAVLDYATLLGDGITLVVDGAARIDAQDRRVELASGAELAYDYLVYAVGSAAAVPAIPGGELVHPVAELEHARRLRAALDELPADAPVTVVGGGLTGIETAGELAEQGRRVTLVSAGRPGPSLSERGRRSVASTLARLGATIVDGSVVEVRANAVVLGDGVVLPSALTVWTAGFGVPELAARSGLRTDPMGKLLTDETLTSVDDDRIVAAGDAAAPSGMPLRMSCQAAGPLAAQAANTVLARLSGDAPKPLDQAFVGSCISIGRSAATIQVARRDDSPTGVVISGRMGARIKEAICKGTVWGIRREARKPGSTVWLKAGPRATGDRRERTSGDQQGGSGARSAFSAEAVTPGESR